MEIIQSAQRKVACKRTTSATSERRISKPVGKLLMEVKAEISNARIVAMALQRYPLSWPIGIKTYEPPKIWHFLEAMWNRVPSLFQELREHDRGFLESLLEQTETITRLLRSVKSQADDQADSLPLALQLFPELKRVTARFLEYHFRGKLAGC